MGKILITGANGFIGRNLVRKFLASKREIIATDICPPKSGFPTVEFALGDLTESDFTNNLVKEADGIIHLAAISRVSDAAADPANCIKINVLGTATLLQAAQARKHVPWFILASSREVDNYEQPGCIINSTGIYALSKKFSEEVAQFYYPAPHHRLTIFRLSDVYGDIGDNQNKVLSIFIHKALRGEALQVNSPDMLCHFTHITDVTGAFLKAIEGIENKKNIVPLQKIWPAQGITLQELAETVCELSESDSEIIIKPPTGWKYQSDTYAKHEKADTDFRGSITLREGLLELIKAYRKRL